MKFVKYTGKAVMISALLFLFSCASYHQQSYDYYSNLKQGNYQKASTRLDHNRLLQKKRNRLLFLLEKGRVEHLLQNFEKSNEYFNAADSMMEGLRTSAKDIVLGTLLNPMMQTYQGEDFEKYMVHYYKALNYLQLNNTEEALVEARRISLRTYAQDDRYDGNRYTQDAFSFILQSLIYEKAGDLNNAFIACRNAADLYMEHNEEFYGTKMPMQLKKDLLRLAWQNGFIEELEWYESRFQLKCERNEIKDDEVVIFWENGTAPVKKEEHLFFTLGGNGNDQLFFQDQTGRYRVPYDQRQGTLSGKISETHTFHVALPRYETQVPVYQNAFVTIDGKQFELEKAQNINELAYATLQERWLKELSSTLSRMAVKKLAEEAAKPKKDEKDHKKKQRAELLSSGIKVFNLFSEKADTRNWQSLPNSIYYTRIAVPKGTNQIDLNLDQRNGTNTKREILLKNKGRLQLYNISTQ